MKTLRSSLIQTAAVAHASLVGAAAYADGYQFNARYTVDLLSNTSGGIMTGTRYLDNLDLMLEIDVAEAWGFGGGTLFLYGLYNNGTTFSDELVGDLQVVSNIDAVEAWRVYEAWYEFGGERWSVRSGLYDLNSEFDVKETGALFLNSSHGIGPDFSQTGLNGPSIFPVTSLAVRTAAQWGNVTTRLAIFDGVPGDPDNPASSAIDLSGDDGTLIVGEVDAPLTDSGRLWAGYWRYSADFERPFDMTVRDGNDGWYVGVERHFEPGARRVAGYLRYGRADGAFNPVESFTGAGLVIHAPFTARPQDQFGLSVAMATVGRPYKASLSSAGIRPESSEITWELTYRAEVNASIALQPDIQFVQNPASTSTLDDAWVVGLRVQLSY